MPPPASAYERGVEVALVPVVRNYPASVDPRIKSNNLLNNVLAMQHAIRHGPSSRPSCATTAATLRSVPSRTSSSSRAAVRTPELAAGLLAGITRAFVEDVAAEAGVPIVDGALKDEDLFGADQAFLTSTTREVVPIVRVDDRVIGRASPGRSRVACWTPTGSERSR